MKLIILYGKFANYTYLVDDDDIDVFCLNLIKWRLKTGDYYFDEDALEARRIIRSNSCNTAKRAMAFLQRRQNAEYEAMTIKDIQVSSPYGEILFDY